MPLTWIDACKLLCEISHTVVCQKHQAATHTKQAISNRNTILGREVIMHLGGSSFTDKVIRTKQRKFRSQITLNREIV